MQINKHKLTGGLNINVLAYRHSFLTFRFSKTLKNTVRPHPPFWQKYHSQHLLTLCGAPHREHSEFVCGCWGSQRGGEVGAIWAVPCQTRVKQDHPGWRQELGMGSGKLVGGPAGSPSPGLRQQAAAGTLRPCQSGRSPQRPLQPPSSITQQSHSDRGCVCMQKWGGLCVLGRVWGKLKEIFLGLSFPWNKRPPTWKLRG